MNVIEGEIIRVMESWPLQLTVMVEGSPYHVELQEDTKITRSAVLMEPGDLAIGQEVRIKGLASAPSSLAMMGEVIEILE